MNTTTLEEAIIRLFRTSGLKVERVEFKAFGAERKAVVKTMHCHDWTALHHLCPDGDQVQVSLELVNEHNPQVPRTRTTETRPVGAVPEAVVRTAEVGLGQRDQVR